METATGIEFRWLDGDEIDIVTPIMKAHGWVPVNKALGRVRAAFENGKLIGFVPFTCIPHVDGLYVELEHRGTGLAAKLVEDMVGFLYEVDAPAAYVIADSEASAKLAEAHGMAKVESAVYRLVR